jgi:uncharacterized protein YlxW (UPF0749 family)
LKKEQTKAKFRESNDVYKLLEEIDFIKNVNKEKEDTLANVVKEKQSLQEDLEHLQEEMDGLKGNIAKVGVQENQQNLGDELGILDPLAINVCPACEQPKLNIHEKKSHRKLLETS